MTDYVVTHRFAMKAESAEQAAKNVRAMLTLNPQAIFTCTVKEFDTTKKAIEWCQANEEAGAVFEVKP